MGWIGTEVSLDILGLLYGTIFFSHLKQAKKILDGANEGPRDKRKSMKAPPIGPVVSAANVCPDQSTAESPGVFPAQNSGRLKGQLWLQPSSLLS
jgi:hypothetical protein